ncbi:DMT family transporter [Tabrizicola piscis]|nr:DMT family transporter [Tabrizicola piscis]
MQTKSAPTRLNNLIALLLVITGTAAFSVVFASAKLLGSGDLTWQIIFIRYLSGFMVVSVIALAYDRSLAATKSDNVRLHMVRAFCGGSGGAAAIFAATQIPIAHATTIGLLDGVILVLLGVVFLRERLDGLIALVLLLCCVGAYIVVRSQSSVPEPIVSPTVAYIVAFMGAVLVALEGLFIKVLSSKERVLNVLWHVNLFGSVIFAFPAFLYWTEVNMTQFVLIAMLGPLALFGQLCNILGYRMADLKIVAPANYTWIIFAALLGYFVFDESLTLETLVGTALIVLGGILLCFHHDLMKLRLVVATRRKDL